MPILSRWIRVGVLGSLVAAAVSVAAALAMAVSPIMLDLESVGSRAADQISVTNPSSSPLPVEVLYNAVAYNEDGTYELVPNEDDFLVLPTQALIPPGETQVFRIQYLGDPAIDRSRIYEFNFDQVPVAPEEGATAVQIVYSIAAVVAVAPPQATTRFRPMGGEVVMNEDGEPVAQFTIRNDGDRHGYLSQGTLRLTQVNAAGRNLWSRTYSSLEISQTIGLGLLPPHQSRTFQAPHVLPSAEGEIRIELR